MAKIEITFYGETFEFTATDADAKRFVAAAKKVSALADEIDDTAERLKEMKQDLADLQDIDCFRVEFDEKDGAA